jgi:hypothetical protein
MSADAILVVILILPGTAFLVAVVVAFVVRGPRGDPPPPGHCVTCGYDLTGNTSGTCPECGTAVAKGVRP